LPNNSAYFSLDPERVKPTIPQGVLAYVVSISILLTVFHRALGFADYWEWIFDAIAAVALISFFVLRKRQKTRLSVTRSAAAAWPKPNKKIMWLSLALIILTSLSSFLWLPYTGPALSHAQLIIISITTCIFSVAIFFIAWTRSHRSNQSLEPTAGRRDDHL
jgi:predicted MFS family arabinose efflux permease